MDKLIVKVLGTPIGGVSDVDGDGDGFVTGPDGNDNIPAPIQTVVSAIQSIRNALKQNKNPAEKFPIPDGWFNSPGDAKRAKELYPNMHMRYEEAYGMRRYVPSTGLLNDDADVVDQIQDVDRMSVFMWRSYWMPSMASAKSSVGDALRFWRGGFGESRAMAGALSGLEVAEDFKNDKRFAEHVDVLDRALDDAPPIGMKTYRTMRLTRDVGDSANVGNTLNFEAAAVGNVTVALMYEQDEIGMAVRGADKILLEFPIDARGILHDEQGQKRIRMRMAQGGDQMPQEGIVRGRFRVARIEKQTFTNPRTGKKMTRNVHILELLILEKNLCLTPINRLTTSIS